MTERNVSDIVRGHILSFSEFPGVYGDNTDIIKGLVMLDKQLDNEPFINFLPSLCTINDDDKMEEMVNKATLRDILWPLVKIKRVGRVIEGLQDLTIGEIRRLVTTGDYELIDGFRDKFVNSFARAVMKKLFLGESPDTN